MTLSVGIDIIDVGRFDAALRKWPGLAKRIFTDDELATCKRSRDANARLAARFAAKEATFKALGDGWPNVPYHDVEISLTPSGAPALMLRDEAKRLAAGRTAAISLAHSAGLAIADVALGGER